MNRIPLTATVAAMLIFPAGSALAADEHNTVPGLTYLGAPLGLHGVDPVAFLEIGNRIDGTGSYAAVHDGVTYYFASQENLDRFKAAPGRYVPQYGGFCAFGVSVGKKFDGNPHYAAIHDGKLYVFLGEDVLRSFQKDPAGTLAKAEANWKTIRRTAATDL
ncbi:MAG: YHS domain-containing protein [Gammaproteobacteria bacterium]|nr:YHS domain-containing protein [Gammaproteobacteria bacterium]